MNSVTISGETYVNLLRNIQEDCHKSNISIDNEEKLEAILAGSEVLKEVPALNIHSVEEKIYSFVNNELVLFASAQAMGLNPLAKKFLTQWVKKTESKISTIFSIVNATFFDTYYAAKLEKLANKIKWPSFSAPAAIEKEMYAIAQSLLLKDIVFTHFHPEPPETCPSHVNPFIKSVFLCEERQYLVNKYAHTITTLNFSNDQGVTDDKLKKLMLRFCNLKSLDINGCVNLTKKCLAEGHPTLSTIELSNTVLSENNIPKELFPDLTEVKGGLPVKVVKLNNSSIKSQSWEKLGDSFNEADVILGDNIGYFLNEKFCRQRSWEGVEALLSFEKNAGKVKGPRGSCTTQTIELFLDTLDTQPKFTTSLNKLLIEMLKENGDNKVSSLIKTYYLNRLTLTPDKVNENTPFQPAPTIAKCTAQTLALKRSTILYMIATGFSFSDNYFIQMRENLRRLDRELFFQDTSSAFSYASKDPKTVYSDTRDNNVVYLEILLEFYTLMSHHRTRDFDSALPLDLNDPSKIRRSRHTSNNDSMVVFNFAFSLLSGERAGEHYKKTTDKKLACFFVQKMSSGKREEELTNILTNFVTYKSSKQYPLSKLVLGVIDDNDIPPHDNECLIVPLLKEYKGVFSENVKGEIKEEYWKALLSGRLGGHNQKLIDGLKVFYHSEYADKKMKNEILEYLATIGNILGTGPFTGHVYSYPSNNEELAEYAREAYIALKETKRENLASGGSI